MNSYYENNEEYILNGNPHYIAPMLGVTVAFAGEKERNNQKTGEPCIVVGVEKKISLHDIPKNMLIPSEVKGVPTDVIEFPRLYSITTCTGGGGGGCPPHDERYRPLIGGISAIQETSTACTLGLIVRDLTDGTLVALTNNHCAGLLYDPSYSTPTFGSLTVNGINMMQPSPYDGGTSADIYGQVKRAVAMKFGGIATNSVDCSISSIEINDSDYSILELNEGPFPFSSKSDYLVGEEIYKSGRTTGNIPPPTTTVTSKNALVNVDYSGGLGGSNNIATFTNQVICESATRFGQGGDSGSAVLIYKNGRYRFVGLHFAGNSAGTLGVFCPGEDIASALDVEWWNGDVILPYTEQTTVVINGHNYQAVGPTLYPVSHSSSSSSSSSGLMSSSSSSGV